MMTIKAVAIWMVIAVYSSQVLSGAAPGASKCSRQSSREAAHILHEKVYKPAMNLLYTLPSTCPLVSDNILFLEHEKQKERTHSGRFRCGICKKQFRNEMYMDKHFDNKHPESIQSDSLCLADYCDILSCPTYRSHARHAKCTHSSLRRLQQTCQALFQACFPYEEPLFNATTLRHGEPASNRLYDHVIESICNTITCEAPEEMDPPSISAIIVEAIFKLMGITLLLFGVIYFLDRPPTRAELKRQSRLKARHGD